MTASPSTSAPTSLADAFRPFPLGSVRPLGWLRDQLTVQANGLSGHLEEFWPDLGPDNMWRGGSGEGWERAPYYLDGLIPLAYALDDERLKGMAQGWIESILSMQDETGWIGPVFGNHSGHEDVLGDYDVWPITLILKAFLQYEEATGDPRIVPFALRFARYLDQHLERRSLVDWMRYRWQDLALSLQWLYRRTGEGWLLDLVPRLAAQGHDWTAHFADLPFKAKISPRSACTREGHGPNNAMGLKTGAVLYRQTADPEDAATSRRAVEEVHRYHGQAGGVFSADEHFAGPAPTQGTELCSIVEEMYSYEWLLAILGDPEWGDRLERAAYNALPSVFTPDMWAHQYDGQANQVLVSIAPRGWTYNGPDANVYGLEPYYGCCTANLHQGWPKFAASLWMGTPDGGLAAVGLGPSEVATTVHGIGVRARQVTDYPFREVVSLEVETDGPVRFPLLVRVPAWAHGATLDGAPVAPGEFAWIVREWRGLTRLPLRLPMPVRTERRHRESVTLLRGPLVFALRVGEKFRHLKGEPPHADWEVHPTTPWNVGLSPRVAARVTVEERPLGPRPFDPADPPVVLRAPARRVPEWGMEENSAAPVPIGAEGEGLEEVVELIPYGSGHLRVTEFPVLAERRP